MLKTQGLIKKGAQPAPFLVQILAIEAASNPSP